MKILVSGSLAFDKIMNFPGKFSDHILPEKIHQINLSFAVQDLKENFGGTAGNIAFNLALLSENSIVLAAAGNDFSSYAEWLKNNNVNVDLVNVIADEKTTCAFITTDSVDNQITAFYMGAMKYTGKTPDKNLLSDAWAIVAPGNVEDMVALPKLYKEHGVPYIFDPGQQLPVMSADNLRDGIIGANVLISNDYELSLIMDKIGWNEAKILENVEILVTTLGEKGALIKTKSEIYSIPPAHPENTCDPTGAGDAFRAGFIKGLINGWPVEIAGKFASVVAVYTVEKYGTQTHKFNFEEVDKRYKNNFNELLPK